MTQEGKFFTSLGQQGRTFIPGGIDTDGDVKIGKAVGVQEFFDCEPVVCGKVLADGTTRAHAAPTGAAGDENMLKMNGPTWEYHILGTQTILSPIMGTGGLNVSMDQTNNDGVELCLGINAANRGVFKVGTSPAFYAKLTFSIEDVSGTDDCAFGFRKVEAYQANIDDYYDMAVLNAISGNINTETILNNGATVTTDTTLDWDDAETHTLEVLVSATGVVTYKVDGVTPPTTVAYTLANNLNVVPFFYFLHDSDVAGAVVLKNFECGLQ